MSTETNATGGGERPSPSGRPAGGIRKHLLLVFLACVVFYGLSFWGVESWRKRRGPWEVTFRAEGESRAVLEINQPRLGVKGVVILVEGAVLAGDFAPRTVRFDRPERRSEVPFGRVRFLDTTFLPGTVTLDLFGHEVELLPRVLIVDRAEHAWREGQRLELAARSR